MITWSDLPIIVLGILIGKIGYSIFNGIILGIRDFIQDKKQSSSKEEKGENDTKTTN